MINILIRNSIGRQKLLTRCLKSVADQTHQEIKVFISTDSNEVYDQTIEVINSINFNRDFKIIEVTPDTSKPFYWNLYCNTLKAQVKEGWFIYVDSDDFLFNKHVIKTLSNQVNQKYATICRFLRKGRPKPSREYRGKIVRGKIGGSCIVLHHSHKDLADWQACKAADYFFIKDISELLPFKWIDLVVVEAGNNGLKGQTP